MPHTLPPNNVCGSRIRLKTKRYARNSQHRRMTMEAERPPLPPFTTDEDAARKVRLAEDAWNGRDPARVALAYTPDSRWRNRAEFITGREAIEAFLTRKWDRELDYRLIKELPDYAPCSAALDT